MASESHYVLEGFEAHKRGSGDAIWELKTSPPALSPPRYLKINYDIKGDSVNIASRIEALCEHGSILILSDL